MVLGERVPKTASDLMALTLITCPNCGHSGFTSHLLPFPLRCHWCGHREMIQGGIDTVRSPEFDLSKRNDRTGNRSRPSAQRTTNPPAGRGARSAATVPGAEA